MKNLLTFITCIGFFLSGFSQITSAEYFIDGVDPGIGSATALAVTAGNTINENYTIPTAGLADGLHVLHIRVKGTNNVWSLYKRAYFHVQSPTINGTPQNIVAAEYYIDADNLGVGNQIPLTVTQGLTINETFAIPTTGLADGLHVLHIRVKDANNVWSLYKRAYFYIRTPSTTTTGTPAIISAAEFFIDNDTTVGGETPLTVTQGLTINEAFAIPTTGLANGLHVLHIRVKDANNVWSLYKRAYFYIHANNSALTPTPITAAEYFFGNTVGDDPGVGNATALTVTQGMTINEAFTIPVPASLTNGDYYLHIRVKDQNGTWSLYKRAIFTIDNTVSVEEFNSDVFTVYPNPSKDILFIDFQEVGEYSLSVFDITGKELYQQKELEQQNSVDLSNYASGIYFIKIKEIATNKFQNIKIIKE